MTNNPLQQSWSQVRTAERQLVAAVNDTLAALRRQRAMLQTTIMAELAYLDDAGIDPDSTMTLDEGYGVVMARLTAAEERLIEARAHIAECPGALPHHPAFDVMTPDIDKSQLEKLGQDTTHNKD